MREQYAESSSKLEQANRLVEKNHPYLASQIGLLAGEVYRHAGQQKKWQEAWATSVEQHSRWSQGREINDPGFWKKAAFLKPLNADWPQSVYQRIQTRLKKSGLEFAGTRAENKEAAPMGVYWASEFETP